MGLFYFIHRPTITEYAFKLSECTICMWVKLGFVFFVFPIIILQFTKDITPVRYFQGAYNNNTNTNYGIKNKSLTSRSF